MGLVVLEGLLITVLVLTGFRLAVFERHPAAAQDRDRGRHRLLPRDHRAGRRRLRPAPAAGAAVSFGIDGQLRGWPMLVFVVGLLLTACWSPAGSAARC